MTILIQDIAPHHIGSVFTVDTQNGALPLKLIEAVERPRRGLPTQFRAPISLVFSGTSEWQLAQDCYFVDHPVLGRVQWMLVPIAKHAAPNPDGLPLYEAILS
jgi:hypothetical protein